MPEFNFIHDLIMFLPDTILICTILISIVLLAFKKDMSKTIFAISTTGLSICAVLTMLYMPSTTYSGFYDAIKINNFSLFFSSLILISALICILISKNALQPIKNFKGEFYVLLLSATLGGVFLAQSNDLISVFISLELLSVSTYFLIGFLRNISHSPETVLKYFIYSCMTSALMLYGFSFLYGLTSETNLTEIITTLTTQNLIMTPLSVLAFLLATTAVIFKTSLFPFHMWTSDVYKGSPISIAMFLSLASKTAGFALLLKLLPLTFISVFLIYILSVITLCIGNLLAVRENDIRKFMAYSTIAQAGYITAGMCLFKTDLSAAFFYLVSYLIMNAAAWIAIELFIHKTGQDKVEQLEGLAYINPIIAICLTVSLVSLAGLPLSVGFWAKFYLLKTIFFAGPFYRILFLAVLLNTILGIYYYTKLIKAMFSKSINKAILKNAIIPYSPIRTTILLIFTITILLFGISPALLTDFTNDYLKPTYASLQPLTKTNLPSLTTRQ